MKVKISCPGGLTRNLSIRSIDDAIDVLQVMPGLRSMQIGFEIDKPVTAFAELALFEVESIEAHLRVQATDPATRQMKAVRDITFLDGSRWAAPAAPAPEANDNARARFEHGRAYCISPIDEFARLIQPWGLLKLSQAGTAICAYAAEANCWRAAALRMMMCDERMQQITNAKGKTDA